MKSATLHEMTAAELVERFAALGIDQEKAELSDANTNSPNYIGKWMRSIMN